MKKIVLPVLMFAGALLGVMGCGQGGCGQPSNKDLMDQLNQTKTELDQTNAKLDQLNNKLSQQTGASSTSSGSTSNPTPAATGAKQ